MWRNREVLTFVEWLRSYNQEIRIPENRVGFYGLDLYSLFTSVGAVLDYLDDVDPDAARTARHRYGCLTPWQRDPAAYGRAVYSGRYQFDDYIWFDQTHAVSPLGAEDTHGFPDIYPFGL
jgi:protein-L-isoaspartate(D-aspartate) O-methyltransferase